MSDLAVPRYHNACFSFKDGLFIAWIVPEEV